MEQLPVRYLVIFAGLFLLTASTLGSYFFMNGTNFEPMAQNLVRWKCFKENPQLGVIITQPSSSNSSSALSIEQLVKSMRNNFEDTNLANNVSNRCNLVYVTYFIPKKYQFQSDWKEIVEVDIDNFQQFCNQRENYFEKNFKKIDHWLVVDGDVKFTSKLSAATFVQSSSTAFLHQTFTMLTTTKTFIKQPPLHFSSQIFGISKQNLSDFCGKFTKSEKYHENLNHFFQEHQPSLIIYANPLKSVGNLSEQIYNFQRLENEIQLPRQFQKDQSEFFNYLKVKNEFEDLINYQKTAEMIATNVRDTYFERNVDVFKYGADADLAFFTNVCPVVDQCAGFGDRFRGIVTSFYIAVATGRIFHIETEEICEFFQLNDQLYQLPPDEYNEKYNKLKNTNSTDYLFIEIYGQENFVMYLNSVEFQETMSTSRNFNLYTNRYAGLESMLRFHTFASVIEKTSKFKLGSVEIGHFDYPLFISAALRIVFSQPTQNFDQLYRETIGQAVGWQIWNCSLKIGTQIRTGLIGNANAHSDWSKLAPNRTKCFIERIQQMVSDPIFKLYQSQNANCNDNGKNRHVVVFVTSDSKETSKKAVEEISKQSQQQGTDGTVHVFSTSQVVQKESLWDSRALKYLDWFLLTKMDYLLISKSGFGETA